MWLALITRDRRPNTAPRAAARAEAPRKRLFGPPLLLRRGRRGATAVEFAVVAPAFMLMFLMVIETTWQLTVDLALNIGIFVGSRYGVTGAGYAAGTRDGTILNTIITSTGGVLQQANLTVTSKSYPNAASFASGGSGTAGTGSSGQLVAYTATYRQPFLTPLAAAVLGYSSITHTAQVVVQNEPF